MKKASLLLGLPLLGLAALFIWVGGVNAHVFRSGDNVRIGQDDKVNDSLFAAAQTIDVSSEVFGDVFCAGQNITISGKVHGDVICAGQSVNITGEIDGDVRLTGQTVTVGSDVKGNASVLAQSFTLESDASIERDLTLGVEDASLNGDVGRDVAASGSKVTVAGELGRDFKGELRELVLASTAKVNGKVNVTSQEEVQQDEGSFVAGGVTRTEAQKENKFDYANVAPFTLGWFIYSLLATLFTVLIIALLFPRMLQNVTDWALPSPWRALLVGFGACIAVPVLLIVLTITLIGIPAAIILGLFWLVVLILSPTLTGYYLGRLVWRNSHHVLLTALVGSAILFILYYIPFLGLLALLFTSFLGPGMILLEMFHRTPRPEYQLATTTTKNKK